MENERIGKWVVPTRLLGGRLLRSRSLFLVDLSGLAAAKAMVVRELYFTPQSSVLLRNKTRKAGARQISFSCLSCYTLYGSYPNSVGDIVLWLAIKGAPFLYVDWYSGDCHLLPESFGNSPPTVPGKLSHDELSKPSPPGRFAAFSHFHAQDGSNCRGNLQNISLAYCSLFFNKVHFPAVKRYHDHYPLDVASLQSSGTRKAV